jgi:hypothetical protein
MSGGQNNIRYDAELETFPVGEHPGFKDNDQVNHPDHYNQGKIEVIDFIEDQEHLGFCRQSAIRYICRSESVEKESKEQSLRKAIWYLERELGMHRKEHDCRCG